MVSIIVPVYNVAPYLTRCLNSLIQQTWKDIEILLVDDGSIDGSSEICDSFAKIDRRVKVFHIDHAGTATARNIGIENAKGQHLCFVDGDDWISKTFVETMLEAIESWNVPLVVCGREEYLEKTGRLFKVFTAPQETIVSYEDYDFIGPYQHLTCWGALYDSDLIWRGIRFDPSFKVSEDTLFFVESIKKAGSFAVIPKPLYNYSIRQGSLTHGAYNWDYYTEMLAWERLIEITGDQTLRHRINTRGWLARKCVLAIRRNWKYYKDGELHFLLLSKLRQHAYVSMLSALPFKIKIGILLCRFYPRLYLALRGGRSRYP